MQAPEDGVVLGRERVCLDALAGLVAHGRHASADEGGDLAEDLVVARQVVKLPGDVAGLGVVRVDAGGGEGADVLVSLADGGSHVGDHHVLALVVFLEVQLGVVVDVADIFALVAVGGRGELVGGDRVALVVKRDHDRAADGGTQGEGSWLGQ